MKRKTRAILLLSFVACFLFIAPILIMYSMGYRLDFWPVKITATGGIYIRSFPTAGQITVDSIHSEKPGLLSNSFFVQNLLPGEHSVLVSRDGYHEYFKKIPVEKNEVTKLENIMLIKKDLDFTEISESADYFSVAPNNRNAITAFTDKKTIAIRYLDLFSTDEPDNLVINQFGVVSEIEWSENSEKAILRIENQGVNSYYFLDVSLIAKNDPKKPALIKLPILDKSVQRASFYPESQDIIFLKGGILYTKNGSALYKDVLAYTSSGSNILWLSSDGFLYSGDTSEVPYKKMNNGDLDISPSLKYRIFNLSGKIFLQAGNSLLSFDPILKVFEELPLVGNRYEAMPSPDTKSIIYWNDKNIYFYSEAEKKYENLFTGEDIENLQWINNYYFVFTSGDKIIISETDSRGGANMVDIPAGAKNPEIYFNWKNGSIYFLSDKTLRASEKITP